MQKQVSLLAPVGSFESLQAAINSKADAVYFGVEQLNMRTRSSYPFSIKDLKQIKSICKKAGIRCYLTLNTVMYEHDMQLLRNILKETQKQKIDAVIASDFAVLELCRQMNIPVHISTQANISNLESVIFFSKYADVMVLARELTLVQVKKITDAIKRKKIKGPSGELVQIEIFIHGALCMAISGKCYLSLHAQNASANRGACVQNCRRAYEVTDKESGEALVIENEYIMSPKDLCTIDILDQVIASGVAVLKIEGRTKGADYVQTVTNCYREAIEAVHYGTYNAHKIEQWKKQLATVYNRGFWEGYYLGRKMGEWTPHPGSAATEKKIYIGKGSKYYPKIGVGEFIIESGKLKTGDHIMITSTQCGMVKEKLNSLIVNGSEQTTAEKGDKITFPFATKVTASDKMYKIIADG
ncbi:MAG TPA: peptidase U32 family protein [Chitinophagaceae bacterium]|nr:peptidase U32 family protein [Chitinophagaceae bacterium]